MAKDKVKATVVAEPISREPVYRKIAKSGAARYLSVTQQVPIDWHLVELTAIDLKDNVLTLRLRKVA